VDRARVTWWLGRARSGPVIAIFAVVVLVLAGYVGYSVGNRKDPGPNCSNPVNVTVAAAPELAPVLGHIAANLTTAERTDGNTCYLYQVFGQDPAQVTAALTKGGTVPADVWVPDSTYWLHQVAQVDLEMPTGGQSIASSPIVLGVTRSVAQQLGYPARPLSWRAVLDKAASAENALPVGISDPATSPIGLYALLAVRAAVQRHGGTATAQTTRRTAVFRAMSGNVAPPSQDLIGALTKSTGSPGALSAAPVREQALIAYNQGAPSAQLVGAYPELANAGLDYPYIVLPQANQQVRNAAQKFLGDVLTADPREFASRGFRLPDGARGPGFPDQQWVSPQRERAAPLSPEGLVGLALGEWTSVNRSGRLLTVIDVSGSMNEPVPGTTTTRMELTKQAAQMGLGLFKPTTESGLWIFSTDLSPGKDYQELLPIEPIYIGRDDALAKISQIQAKPNGATGLYDTVLAGYQTLRRGWNPGRINALIVLTDGQNEDPNGISRDTLLAELKKLADPKKPLYIVFIGIGPGVNEQELTSIASVAGGRAFVTPDPRKIREIFLTALAAFQTPPAPPPGR
jgi:ABC-type molybdate transport system substrate-binding protein